MTFTLRQVSRRMSGGEIVRVRAIDSPTPVIGRGTDCEIHLTDLAAGLRHARLSAAEPGWVKVEALDPAGFRFNGRIRREAEMALADQPSITIGRHRLSFSAGEDGAVMVTVEADGATAAPLDERAVFSLGAAAPWLGRRTLAWIGGLTVAILCLALPVGLFLLAHGQAKIHADRQWSSGPLSKAHAFLEGDCQACHRQAFVAVRDSACLSCHSAAAGAARALRVNLSWGGSPAAPPPVLIFDHAAHARLDAARPLQGSLAARIQILLDRAFNHSSDRCASCHREHFSARAATPTRPDVGADRLAKPPLILVNRCQDCHDALRSRLPDAVVADAPDWRRHPPFRPLVWTRLANGLSRPARVTAASARLEDVGLVFSHRFHLDTTGYVARTAMELGAVHGYGAALGCANCHHPAASGGGFATVTYKRDCQACHSLAFAGGRGNLKILPHGSVSAALRTLTAAYGGGGLPAHFVEAGRPEPPGLAAALLRTRIDLAGAARSPNAARVAQRTFGARGLCAQCHLVAQPTDIASLDFRITRVRQTTRYLARGAFDHALAAHHVDALGRATCAACHAAKTSERAGDVLIPAISRCAACHGALSASGSPRASAVCEECHSYHRPSEPARPFVRDWRAYDDTAGPPRLIRDVFAAAPDASGPRIVRSPIRRR